MTSSLVAQHLDEKDCKRFRKGTFHLYDPEVGLTVIKRTKKYQIEEIKAKGLKIRLLIDWIDDCSFTLKFDKNLGVEKIPPTDIVIKVEMTKIDGNICSQIITSDKSSIEFKTDIRKIN